MPGNKILPSAFESNRPPRCSFVLDSISLTTLQPAEFQGAKALERQRLPESLMSQDSDPLILLYEYD